jgi:hypothetical protein
MCFCLPLKGAGYVGRARDNRHRDWVDRVLHAAVGRALGFHALDAGRRDLTGRQAVNLVVHNDVGQVNVAPHGVKKVIAADAETVAVATGAYDFSARGSPA